MAMLQRSGVMPLTHNTSRKAAVLPAPGVAQQQRMRVAAAANRSGDEVGWLADHIESREEARKGFRTVYDFPNWQKHRSQFRLIDRLLQTPQSTIMGNIVPSVVWVGLIGLSVSAWHYALGNNILPEGTPDVNLGPAASTFIAQTSAVLSLLLVFRTNASYGRWDEARKMWGLLLNRSRDIVRMGMTMIPDDEPEIKRALAKWTYATAISLRIHFQPGEFKLEDFLKDTLTAREIKSLEDAPHRPVRAIHTLSQVVMNSKMDSIEKTTLGTNITQFHDILGGCERLLRAPIPVSYTRHTARFLFIWLTLLPIAIYPNVGDFTAPIVVAVAAVLCGVEEIGVQCEEPFGILPLEVICGRVKADVMKTLEDDLSVKATLEEAGCGRREPAAGKYVSASSSATSNGRPSWVVSQESMKAQ